MASPVLSIVPSAADRAAALLIATHCPDPRYSSTQAYADQVLSDAITSAQQTGYTLSDILSANVASCLDDGTSWSLLRNGDPVMFRRIHKAFKQLRDAGYNPCIAYSLLGITNVGCHVGEDSAWDQFKTAVSRSWDAIGDTAAFAEAIATEDPAAAAAAWNKVEEQSKQAKQEDMGQYIQTPIDPLQQVQAYRNALAREDYLAAWELLIGKRAARVMPYGSPAGIRIGGPGVASTGASTVTKVAATAGGVAAAGFVTAALIAWAKGRSINWVLDKAWQGVKRPFHR